MSKVIDSAALYFREGTSDKVYNCSLEESGGGCVVNFSYGRRGNALTSGTKTTSPVTLDKARQIYDKLVREKTGKGYRPVGDVPGGIPTVQPPATPTPSRCVLLNSIDEGEASRLMRDDAWAIQEKVDGVRFMLERGASGALKGFNRLGVEVPVPNFLRRIEFSDSFLLDGELVGDTYHVFDALQIGIDLTDEPFRRRFARLQDSDLCSEKSCMRLVKTADELCDKVSLRSEIVSSNGEGLVFKRLDARYRVGRPASGGDYLKFKFTQDCTCIVAEVNDRRSVRLSLRDGRATVNAGNVTIPPNHEVPKVGATVDVRYLYAFRESGALFQPVYLGERTDVDSKSCTVKQLKYKSEEDS